MMSFIESVSVFGSTHPFWFVVVYLLIGSFFAGFSVVVLGFGKDEEVARTSIGFALVWPCWIVYVAGLITGEVVKAAVRVLS